MLRNTTTDDAVKKAVVVIKEMSADEKERHLAWLRERAIWEAEASMEFAKDEGRAEGLAEGRTEIKNKLISTLKSMGKSDKEINELLTAMDNNVAVDDKEFVYFSLTDEQLTRLKKSGIEYEVQQKDGQNIVRFDKSVSEQVKAIIEAQTNKELGR